MKLNAIGALWPRLETAPHKPPIAGSEGSGRLVAPAEIDAGRQTGWTGVDATPVPLRFPWLSRQTQFMPEATGSRPGFDAAPVLGDKLDTWT